MIDKISFIKFIVLATLVPPLYWSFNHGEIVIPTLLTLYPSLLLVLVLIFTERFALMNQKKNGSDICPLLDFYLCKRALRCKVLSRLDVSVINFGFQLHFFAPNYLFGRSQKVCWSADP